MTAAALAEKLDARWAGREWHAFCPVHRGKSRSLHFRDGDAGGILIICRAGCEVRDVLRGLGLSFRDISPTATRAPRPAVVREAEGAARSSISRNLPASVRQQPITMIYTNPEHVDQAIARALALVAVKREFVQLALRGEHDRAS
jgi:hypothetical protein